MDLLLLTSNGIQPKVHRMPTQPGRTALGDAKQPEENIVETLFFSDQKYNYTDAAVRRPSRVPKPGPNRRGPIRRYERIGRPGKVGGGHTNNVIQLDTVIYWLCTIIPYQSDTVIYMCLTGDVHVRPFQLRAVTSLRAQQSPVRELNSHTALPEGEVRI